MTRSVWKGPFVDGYLLKKADAALSSGRKDVIKTWSRRSTILPQFVGLTFGVAASTNFPILLLSMYWKGLTTKGALIGGTVGLVSAVTLVVLSKSVWVTVLGHEAPVFPYEHPALFSMPLAFIVTMLVSVLDGSLQARREREAFDDQYVRAQTGIGAAAAHAH